MAAFQGCWAALADRQHSGQPADTKALARDRLKLAAMMEGAQSGCLWLYTVVMLLRSRHAASAAALGWRSLLERRSVAVQCRERDIGMCMGWQPCRVRAGMKHT